MFGVGFVGFDLLGYCYVVLGGCDYWMVCRYYVGCFKWCGVGLKCISFGCGGLYYLCFVFVNLFVFILVVMYIYFGVCGYLLIGEYNDYVGGLYFIVDIVVLDFCFGFCFSLVFG